jgi:asparagine synthase (glutamine-hydrolysing)
MSGIAGILSPNGKDHLNRILEKIKHRGTTQPSVWVGPNAALGIVQLEKLNEHPGLVTSTAGERSIVWDGRLTNRKALLADLQFHTIKLESEAEVALHLYEDLGTRAVGKLEGEFSMAIVEQDHFLLARDRLGIRPLYFGFFEGALCFASEIKGLVDLVAEVCEFPPGHFLISDWGLFPYEPYFPESIQLDGALDSAEHLAEHLGTAVQRAIGGMPEVGVWLSGGVDSSVIAALARPFVDRLHTFSAGVEGAPDIEYARQVAEHIGAVHHERLYTLDEMKAIVEKVIYYLEAFDAPLVRSSIANYLVSELSADYVPFVLSGEGGDELFAGYAYQKSYQSEVELTLSVQESIASLHNSALQRVDRSAAAHSIGSAVPFLDPDVVRYALAIPARWKIRGPQSIEKWPLRQGLAYTLPDEVIWRGKAKFWEGAGSGQMMAEIAELEISDEVFLAARDLGSGEQLYNKEELRYYEIFKGYYGEKVPLPQVWRTAHI